MKWYNIIIQGFGLAYIARLIAFFIKGLMGW